MKDFFSNKIGKKKEKTKEPKFILRYFGCWKVFCVPFVWTHEAIDHEVLAKMDLIGQVTLPSLATYLDIYLLIIFGGIPWQVRPWPSPSFASCMTL